MLKIAILLDKKNDWLKDYLHELKFKNKKNNFKLFYDYKKIKSFDLVFILGYTRILPISLNKNNKLTLIIHESNLPKGKGFSPIQWQILNGKNVITFSLIDLNKNIDSGDIYDQIKLKLNGQELFDEIRNKQAITTFKLITNFVDKYPLNTKRKQKGRSTYYRKRTQKDGKLNINRTINNQFNLLRIGDNDKWPSYFIKNGIKYILKIYKEN